MVLRMSEMVWLFWTGSIVNSLGGAPPLKGDFHFKMSQHGLAPRSPSSMVMGRHAGESGRGPLDVCESWSPAPATPGWQTAPQDVWSLQVT